MKVRLASANSLHERLVFLDDARAWVLGAPFSELAKRPHTALIRMRPEDEARKIAVYSEIWDEADPLAGEAAPSIEKASGKRTGQQTSKRELT